MDLSLGEDQLTLRAAFAEFFDKESTLERVRAAEPLGFDQDLWTKLAGTGAVAMGLPEDAGGGGASHLDLVLVAEQYGRRIAPVPFIEAVAADLLGSVAAGSTLATIALSPARDGRLRLVPAGAVAEVVVALDGDRLIALTRQGNQRDQSATRPHVEPTPNFAASPLSDWRLDDGDLTVLASGPQAVRLYQDGVSRRQLLMAAALGGLRSSALE